MLILERILKSIEKKRELANVEIKEIHLGRMFNVIYLSTGEVGAAMNYYQYAGKEEQIYLNQYLFMLSKVDHLLLRTLFGQDDKLPQLLKYSLQNTLINALSQDILREGRGDYFTIRDISSIEEVLNQLKLTGEYVQEEDWATVIGFGGALRSLAEKGAFKNIHVSDLGYDAANPYYKDYVDKINIHHKNISLSNGFNTKEMISKSKVVYITGSALSNGTMEELLKMVSSEQIVIIQGESCSIDPEVLFKHYKVDMVVTTLKDEKVLDYLKNDYEFFCKGLFENFLDEKLIVKNEG